MSQFDQLMQGAVHTSNAAAELLHNLSLEKLGIARATVDPLSHCISHAPLKVRHVSVIADLISPLEAWPPWFIYHGVLASRCPVRCRRQEHDPPKLGADGRLKRFHLALDGRIGETLTVQRVDPALQLGVKCFLSAGRYLRSHPRGKLHHERALLRERKRNELGAIPSAAMMGKWCLHGRCAGLLRNAVIGCQRGASGLAPPAALGVWPAHTA